MLQAPGAGGQLQTFGGHGKVDAEGRFSFPSVEPDSYRFAHTWNVSSARDKWVIKSATANGREAFEAPLRVNAGEPVEWTITFTDTPTTLTGLFQDRGGRAATEYYILAFSSDRKHWTPGSRRIRMTRPATDGAFTFKGLLPGEYFLVAAPRPRERRVERSHASNSSSDPRPGSRSATERRRRATSELGRQRRERVT